MCCKCRIGRYYAILLAWWRLGQFLPNFDSPKGFTKVKRLPFVGSEMHGPREMKYGQTLEFDRSRMYCDGIISVSSFLKVNDNLAAGALIAGYRMPKEPDMRDKHYWACCDFNNYKCIPQSWISTRNSIYTFGDVGVLNEPIWTTGFTEK